jgi:serine/threonine-protein kinase RsbW
MTKQKALSLEMTFDASSEFVGIVRLAISGIASRMNFSIEEIEDIKISVSEACTNAIHHAYKNVENAKVTIHTTIFPDKLEIIVKDDGIGFDTSVIGKVKHPEAMTANMNLGLGLTFVESLMDETEFNSTIGKGSVIRMIKKVPLPS